MLDGLAVLAFVPLLAQLTGDSGTGSQLTSAAQWLVGSQDSAHTALVFAIIAGGLLLLRSIAAAIFTWLSSGVLNDCTFTLAREVVVRYAHAPWLVAKVSGMGDLVRNTTTSASTAVNTVIGAALLFLGDMGVILFVIAALMVADPVVAVSAMAYIGLVSVGYLKLVRVTVLEKGKEAQLQAARANDVLFTIVGGLREIRVRGTQDVFLRRYGDSYRRVLHSNRVLNFIAGSTRYLLESVLILGIVAVLVISSTVWGSGGVLLSLGLIVVAGFRVLPAFMSIINTVNWIRASEAAVALLEEEMARLPPATSSSGDLAMTPPVAPELTFRSLRCSGLTFSYPGRPAPALAGVDIEIQRGETIGLVGGSGAGKSTLVDLILGLLQPTRGSVCVNDEDLTGQYETWRQCVGFVPQQVYLANDSVRGNIVFDGEPDSPAADPERVDEVIDLVRLRPLLNDLADGVGTLIGERGTSLSGGQAQRIGLARALYRRPGFLILDEATSALDNLTEAEIGDALATMRGTTTMLIIAHRLSTVKGCDRLIYLEDGRVVAVATFDELVERAPGFRRLVELGDLRG